MLNADGQKGSNTSWTDLFALQTLGFSVDIK